METLSLVLKIAKVALGLGFVIFIHELGHFLLAKWNGVKVEKFSIGFGPTLFGFRRGETEYVLAAHPSGRLRQDAGRRARRRESKSTDPRAYPNKSVERADGDHLGRRDHERDPRRARCFVYYYGHERHDSPAILGQVVAGSPAYEAGLKVGDEIVAIDGRRDLGFTDLSQKVLLSSQGQVLHFEVRRPGQEDLIRVDIQPRREAKGDRPTIGIRSSHGLEIGDFRPLAGMANPPVYHGVDLKDRSKIDVLAAAGPVGRADAARRRQPVRPPARPPRERRSQTRDRARSMTESGAHGPVLERFE